MNIFQIKNNYQKDNIEKCWLNGYKFEQILNDFHFSKKPYK